MASILSMQFNLEYNSRAELLFFFSRFFIHFSSCLPSPCSSLCFVYLCFHDEISFVNRHIHISTRLNEFLMKRRNQIERLIHTNTHPNTYRQRFFLSFLLFFLRRRTRYLCYINIKLREINNISKNRKEKYS